MSISLCGRSRSPGSTGYNDNRYPSKRTRNSRTRSGESGLRSKSCDDKNRHHSLLDQRMSDKRKAKDEEKLKAMEERRVVYVGKIPDGYTKKQLYHQFKSFGEIKEVKVNFREHGDNYGFITFAYASDAVAAKEKGNSIPGVVKFDLCFGGRRHFCPDQYADLDGNREIEEEYAPMPRNSTDELDYAALLKQHSNQQKKKRTT